MPKPDVLRDSLSVRQVAVALGCAPETVLSLIKAGELPAFRVGSRWRLNPEDVESFRTQPAAAVAESVPVAVRAYVDRALDAALADLRVRLHDLQAEAGATVRPAGKQG